MLSLSKRRGNDPDHHGENQANGGKKYYCKFDERQRTQESQCHRETLQFLFP